jgi:hypothetical protein
MAKGGGRASSSSGGIGGSGIFGLVGSTVQCKAEDTSFFCQLSKLVATLMNIIILLAILYFAYTFAAPYLAKGFKKVTGSGRR